MHLPGDQHTSARLGQLGMREGPPSSPAVSLTSGWGGHPACWTSPPVQLADVWTLSGGPPLASPARSEQGACSRTETVDASSQELFLILVYYEAAL